MRFVNHSELKDRHAFLSASKYSWLRYSPERLYEAFENHTAAQRGTELHEFAAKAIKLRQKLQNTGQTVNMYVNDCIGWRMSPEVALFYSKYCFGTADAIDFRDRILRIFDLKTGTSKASADQLLIYAALFCLEYGVKPMDIVYDLRIYQNDAITVIETDGAEIARVISIIEESSRLLTEAEAELL